MTMKPINGNPHPANDASPTPRAGEPIAAVVDYLTDLISRAKNGEVVGVAAVEMGPFLGTCNCHFVGHNLVNFTALGATHMLAESVQDAIKAGGFKE